MRTLKLALTGLFLLLMIATLVVYTVSKPRVLVLHSYATDYPWVRDVNVGLKRVLDQHAYSLRWHYMDTKRHPYPDFIRRAATMARQLIDQWEPQVIIAVDDNAQQWVARHYLNRDGVAVVFAGVGSNPEDYGYLGADNVTGILERMPLTAIRDTMLRIHRARGGDGPLRLVHVTDVSTSGVGNRRQLLAFDWSPTVLLESIEAQNFEDWKAAVADAGSTVEGPVDFLFLTNYHTIHRSSSDPSIVPPDEVVAWTEAHTSLLTLNAWGFYVEDGGMLSIGVSPYEQGEVAAGMAVAIIDDRRRSSDLPIRSTSQFIVYLRGSIMQAKGVTLPAIYEAFARATDNWFE